MAARGADGWREKVTPAEALARATAEHHLLRIAPRLREWGWTWAWTPSDSMRLRLDVVAVRADGIPDPYVLDLGFKGYDAEPPQVRFVLPDPFGQRPGPASRWWPTISGVSWFALHHTFAFAEGPDQLVCFSQSRDYYRSGHFPQPGEAWEHGRHTVAATLARLHEVLTPPYYVGPAGANDL